jgi:tripartite-type tricarboxylate transporter receptor subunit TctC
MRPAARLLAAFLLCLLAWPAASPAQEWTPDRPVRILLPFPPGGATDLVARILAERASRDLPQKWVVENRSGANGNIGMEAAAKSRPDGYTLGACTIGNCAINASIYARMPYDIERDLVPVFWSASVINLLAVHPAVPARTLREFIDWAAANKGRVNYGSSGFGSSNHLSPEILNGRYQLGLMHVPFRGGAPALQALMAGQVQLMLENVPTLVAAAREGNIRAVAVTGRERDPALPDTPTFGEAGVPDVVVEPWFGYMAPRGTPEPVVRRLNALLGEALADPGVQTRLRDLGARPEGGPPERFAAHVRAEIARWRQVVEQNNIEKME